jgi:hypothetical protein
MPRRRTVVLLSARAATRASVVIVGIGANDVGEGRGGGHR